MRQEIHNKQPSLCSHYSPCEKSSKDKISLSEFSLEPYQAVSSTQFSSSLPNSLLPDSWTGLVTLR